MALKPITERRTINNILSISGKNDIVLVETENDNNVLGSFYFGSSDSSAAKKFIKNVEGLVRRSNEYSRYLAILTYDKKLTNDVIFGNIDVEDATTEFHHYPFTLYDITEILLNYHIKNKIKVTSLILAEKVMKLHYDNIIGLVKLSKTAHELTHAGSLFIPMKSVYGDVNKFVETYREYMFPDQIETYNKLIEINDNESYDNSLYSEERINSNSYINEDCSLD